MFRFMDVGENTAENFYHAFVLGMLVGLKDTYYVNSNRAPKGPGLFGAFFLYF